jgi:hypothetical protein
MAIILPIVSNFNKKGINDATAALSQLGDSLKRIGLQVSFAAFMSSSINQARDLQRNIAALEGVFGSYSARMKEFVASSNSFGMSQTETARTVVFLGSVLKSAGFGMEEVSGQTENLTKLAQDLAVTYGYDVTTALTAMTAMFRGEYDPIEKFGVALKQNEVNAIVAAKGLDHLTGVELLNAQQHVKMEMLYLRTQDAQGAYMRQSESLFVSQINLSSAFKDLQANAAQPLTIALGKLFAGMVPLVKDAGPGLTQTFTQFADIIITLTPLLTPLASLAGVLSGAFNGLIAVLGTLVRELVGPVTTVITIFTNLLVGLFSWVNENAGAIVVWTTAILGVAAAIKVATIAFVAFEFVAALVGKITIVIRTLSVAVAGYMSSVAGATLAQALFNIALGAIHPAALVIGLAVIGTGIALIASEAMTAKFQLDGLNAALDTTANKQMPTFDFSGGAPVGLPFYKVKNPMDGMVTTWFSGGKWYTGTFKDGKWSTPKEYKAPAAAGKSGSGSAAVAKDTVADFYKNLRDEIDKQSARLKLRSLGASEALVESILGTGEDFRKVLARVTAKGKEGIASLQKQFNKTGAGFKEGYDAAVAAAKKLFDEQTALYEKQKEAYDQQVQAIKELKSSLGDITAGLTPLAVATREIGEFENAIIDSFDKIVETITKGLADGTLLKASADTLTKYANSERKVIQDIMRQRDELVQRRSDAKALINDVRETILGLGNITEILAKNTTDVTQTITKMVGNVQVATATVIKSSNTGAAGLVKSFTDTLAKTKEFAQQLKNLRALGLDKNLYQQIVTAGIDAGGATAKAILEGGTGTVGELNALFNELDAVGSSIAEQSAQVMYGAGVDLVDGLINGLISKEQALVDYATELATLFTGTFTAEINKALPMPSAPSAPVYVEPPMPTVSTLGLRLGDIKLGKFGATAQESALAAKLIASPKATAWTTTINVNAGMGTDGKQVGQAIYSELLKFAKSSGIKI